MLLSELSSEAELPDTNIPKLVDINIYSGEVYDYYDGPCSGSIEHNGKTLVFYYWGGDRDFVLADATGINLQEVFKLDTWEARMTVLGDCEIVGWTSW